MATLPGFTYVVDVASLADAASAIVRSLALDLAASAPFLVLELGMFAIVLYGLMVRPKSVGDAIFGIVPRDYQDGPPFERPGQRHAVRPLRHPGGHRVVTFPIAFLVFYALGYDDVFVLSVIVAVFQFVPVLGSGVLATGMAAATSWPA